MKKRLNLFSARNLPASVVNYNVQIKKYALIALMIIIISYGAVFGVTYLIRVNTKNVINSTTSYENYVSNNQALSQDLKRFIFKYSLLKNFSTGDARGSEYFSNFQNKIRELDINLNLDSFSMDSSRATQFTITFADYETTISFIESLETAPFQEAFETLTLDSFNLSSSEEQEFSLNFSGIFTNLEI